MNTHSIAERVMMVKTVIYPIWKKAGLTVSRLSFVTSINLVYKRKMDSI